MRRPLAAVAVCLAAGILASGVFQAGAAAALAAAAFLLAAAVVLLAARRPPAWSFLCALAAVAILGCAYGRVRAAGRSGAALSAWLSQQPRLLRIRGVLLGIPETRRFESAVGGKPSLRTYFHLRVRDVRVGERWFPAAGTLRAFGEGEATCLTNGDRLDVVVRAWEAAAPGNPGEFDYAAYLERTGVSGMADLGSASHVRPASSAGAFAPAAWVHRLKRRVTAELNARVDDPAAAVLRRLILGERHALADRQLRAFQETGTVHFLAISGLHVGIVAVFAWWVLLACRAGVRLSAVIVLLIVLLYAALAGFRPSVQRAAVMCAVVCGAFLFNRKPCLGASLALSAIVILLHDPAEAFNAGFQLSFAAVIGIVLFAGPLERGLFGAPDNLDRLVPPEERPWAQRPVRWFLQKAASVSIAAWLATLPLTLRHFGFVAPFAFATSLLLIPAVWLSLAAGLPGVLLAPVLGDFVQPLLASAAFGARFMDWATALLARVPGVVLYLPSPGWAWVGVCYAAAAVIAGSRFRIRKLEVALLLLVAALSYLPLVWLRPPPRHATLAVLATGQGNCVLLRLPSGQNLLFDAGGDGGTIGERAIVPALHALGVRRIDLAVVSHGDADHYNGFAEVARRIPVGRVALPAHFENHSGADILLAKLEAAEIPPVRIAAGDRIEDLDGTEVDVLWPPRAFPFTRSLSDNELSAVLRIAAPGGTILLTGDFGRRATKTLLTMRPDVRAAVLQVSHHGHFDPAGPMMNEAVRPAVALVPGEISEWCREVYGRGARLYGTQEHGMIQVVLDPERGPTVIPYRTGPETGETEP